MQPRRLIALATCMLAASALVGGCLSEEAARRTLRKDDPRKQAAMIARIARENKTSMTGELIRLLDAEDEGVRFMAAVALHKVTGIDRGIHFAEGEPRKTLVAEWHRWYEAETGEPVPEAPPEPEDDDAAEPDTVDWSALPAADVPTEPTPPAAKEAAPSADAPDDDAPADREPEEYVLPEVETASPPGKTKEKGG